jgi:ABC-type multidrug transport system fused ATPase/permease subunit
LLRLGNAKTLETSDVPRIPPSDRSERLVREFQEAWRSQARGGGGSGRRKKRSIARALAIVLWKDIAATGMLALLKALGLVMGPIFLYFFVDYTSGNVVVEHEGALLVIGVCLMKLMENFGQRHWFFGVRRLGMKAQAAVMGAVYEKELRLSNSGRRRHAAGEIVNYVSVDSYRICELAWQLHWAWVVPFVTLGALCVLFAIAGLAASPGLVLVVLFVLLLTPLMFYMQRSQGEFMVAQDERLRATSEVLSGIKVIKLQAWEEKFMAFLQKMRDVECKWLYETQTKRNYANVAYWSMPTIVTSVVLAACILLGMELTYTLVFTILATFRIIQDPIRGVPDVLSTFIQARVSLRRLSEFLEEEELSDSIVGRDRSGRESEFAVLVDRAYLSWDPHAFKPSLRDINVAVRRGQKVAVCGTIGSGKSTLLLALLGEIPKISGKVRSRKKSPSVDACSMLAPAQQEGRASCLFVHVRGDRLPAHGIESNAQRSFLM